MQATKNTFLSSGSALVIAAAGAFWGVAPAEAQSTKPATVATQASADARAKAPDAPESEIVVVIGENNAAAALAPAISPATAREPTTVINRTWIENSVADSTDFTGIAVLTPSLSGESGNGPGLNEHDAVIRGFGDGEYNVTYDGIPFGDTNDPTHHSTAQFPGSTIGAVQVDRGPGDAGNLGQATFGGSINLFSRTLTEEPYAQFKATLGSWNTRNYTITMQSGPVAQLDGLKATANFQHLTSDGYLSNANVDQANEFVKLEKDLVPGLKLTVLATHNHGKINQPDNDGITLAQAAKYGKSFSMSSDPSVPTFYGYNTVEKDTDFEYARLDGAPFDGFKWQNTLYSYAYHNDTRSASDTTQSANDILAGKYPGTGTKVPGALPTDVVGYYKLNAYRVFGDILHVNKDLGSFATVRAGLWYEISDTDRHRWDYDRSNGILNPAETTNKLGATVPPLWMQFMETSSWTQYQPFVDVDIHPVENLTITPGVKYMHFERKADSEVESKTRLPNTHDSQTFEKTLPFLSANYKATNNFSLYAQYAQGFLVPPLAVLYAADDANHKGIKPQQSTNYQVGGIFNTSKLTLDADVYYIEFTDKFQKAASSSKTNPFYENISGTTIYKGVEGEATYAITDDLAAFANGSYNSAKDPAGFQIASAPKWTAAAGFVYKMGPINATLVTKFTGEQWAASSEASQYKIPSYNLTNLLVGYDWGRFKLQGGVFNVFDSQDVTGITVNDSAGTLAANSHDQYFWQAGRSYQLTVRATY